MQPLCIISIGQQRQQTAQSKTKGGGKGNYNKEKKQAGKRYAQRKSLVYLWCVCVSRREQREAAAALRSSAEPSVPPGHPPLSSTASQPLLCPDGKKMCRRQAVTNERMEANGTQTDRQTHRQTDTHTQTLSHATLQRHCPATLFSVAGTLVSSNISATSRSCSCPTCINYSR